MTGRPAIDMTGQVFGRLTVVERAANIGQQAGWLCTCSCGGARTVGGSELRLGKVISCGCAPRRTPPRKTHCVHGHALTVDNVLVNLRGDGRARRECRICFRRRVTASKVRRRARLAAV